MKDTENEVKRVIEVNDGFIIRLGAVNNSCKDRVVIESTVGTRINILVPTKRVTVEKSHPVCDVIVQEMYIDFDTAEEGIDFVVAARKDVKIIEDVEYILRKVVSNAILFKFSEYNSSPYCMRCCNRYNLNYGPGSIQPFMPPYFPTHPVA